MKNDYEYLVTAAGRVNIIGEHIDYCGGKVFPAALSLVNKIYCRKNGTDKINLAWTDIPDKITRDISKLGEYKNVKYADYIAACAYIMQLDGKEVVGADMLIDCGVPFGSGLSSSAAIEVSTLAALYTIAGLPIDKKTIALEAWRAEREYVGMNCGIMDQYASAFGKKDCALLLDCKKVTHEYVPFKLNGVSLVIANTNKPHSLVESKYNDRRAETEEALRLIKEVKNISCLVDLSIDDFEAVKDVLTGVLYNRTKHVVYECDRVNRAVSALKRGDVVKLGELMVESHMSLRDLYEVTGKELDAMFFAARAFDGCVGTRMTGGGFGGCTISLVKSERVAEFEKFVGKRYEEETGYVPSFYVAEISDGIKIEKVKKEN